MLRKHLLFIVLNHITYNHITQNHITYTLYWLIINIKNK